MADHPADDSEGIEVLRVVLIDQTLQGSITIGLTEDAGDWGDLFASLARDVAEALQAQDQADPAVTLSKIKKAFLAGLENVP